MRSNKILFADLLLFLVTAFMALLIRQYQDISWGHIVGLVPYLLLGLPIMTASFLLAGTHKGLWRHVSWADGLRISAAALMGIAMTMFFIFTFNRLDGVSRTLPLLHIPLLVAGMLGARFYVRKFNNDDKEEEEHGLSLMPEFEDDKEHVLIVGLGAVTELYLKCVRAMASSHIRVEGILEERAHLNGRLLQFTKVVGRPQDLASLLSMFQVHGVKIDRIVVAVPFGDLSQESQNVLLQHEKDGSIKLDMFEERLGFRQLRAPANPSRIKEDTVVTPFPVLGHEGLYDRKYEFMKRAMDIIVSGTLIVVGLPVFIIVALLVAYDVGLPVIFWQQRPGRRGRPFRVLKFRTMRAGHDRFGRIIPDEERLSAIGKRLRRYRLDELPQLYHILIGEMSFVGPRPLLTRDQLAGCKARLRVRPGITGWAQINGGNMISIEEKHALDMWYLQHASLWLDLKIIFRTLQIAFEGSGDQVKSRARSAIRLARLEQRRNLMT